MAAQHLLQNFAPARRVGRNQYPAGELVQKEVQRREWMLGPRIDPQLVRCGRWKVGHVRPALQLGVGLEGVEGDRSKLRQPRIDLFRPDEELGGWQDRPLALVRLRLTA